MIFPLTNFSRKHKKSGNWWTKRQRGCTGALFALNVLAVLVSGCERQETVLREQVADYWNARVRGELERAYTLEAPGAPDKATYLKRLFRLSVVFKTFTIHSIKEDGNQAVVELQMEYLLPGLSRPMTAGMLDEWIKVQGQWLHRLPPETGSGSAEERG